MPLTEMAEHTSNTLVQLSVMDPAKVVRGTREVEDLLSNEDAMAAATSEAIVQYETAFLSQFEVLQKRVLYSGLGFVALVCAVTGVMFMQAVISLGGRMRMLLRTVTLIPRRVAFVVKEIAQKDLDRLLEDAQDEEGIIFDTGAQGKFAIADDSDKNGKIKVESDADDAASTSGEAANTQP